jgi:hypothetical protein
MTCRNKKCAEEIPEGSLHCNGVDGNRMSILEVRKSAETAKERYANFQR